MNPLEVVDLAGRWSFRPDGAAPVPIDVPGGGWLKQGFDCESGTYETEITIPASAAGMVVRLELGAVNHLAYYSIGPTVSDLHPVACAVSAFTGQIVDLTQHVRPGQTYVLRIHVVCYQDGKPVAPHNWQEKESSIPRGIFRSVRLALYPPVYIDDMVVRTDTRTRSFDADVYIVNATKQPQVVTLSPELSAWGERRWRYPHLKSATVTVPAGERCRVTLATATWLEGPESYWWPAVPYRPGYRTNLHHLHVGLQADGVLGHRASVRFGFRQLRQEGEVFTLNDVTVRFRGDSLQVANYDTIDHGGRGDAIDTLPGFLPPSDTCGGWPQAVDNMLRLGFNVQRAHRQPWSPYMLDVCDEMGLMIIGEAADGWEEFDHAYFEMDCLRDMVVRDRNHPCIVRWSLKNEPLCPDPTYHRELYDTVKEVDSTRPICEGITLWKPSIYHPDLVFRDLMDEPDFTWLEQFLTYGPDGEPAYSAWQHNNAVRPIRGRPFGLGGSLYPSCSATVGLTRFATTVARVRADGASDVRPYTLVAGWVSQVPGVATSDVILEEKRHPVYGEDNLPDPWANPQIQLIQWAMHPLLAFDYDFLVANEEGNDAGTYPFVIPQVEAGAQVRRRIVVFNDELAGTDLTLAWSVHTESPANDAIATGRRDLAIEPGQRAWVPIEFAAPGRNCAVFLVLEVWKDGQVRFHDESTCLRTAGGVGDDYFGQPGNTEVPDRWLVRKPTRPTLNDPTLLSPILRSPSLHAHEG